MALDDPDEDFRVRFSKFQALEGQKDAFVLEVLEKLEKATGKLDEVMRERTSEVTVLKADLESERESRRGWQDKAQVSRERFLARGLPGGQAAADEFMAKVREYLVSLGFSAEEANTIPVVVKAYANLSGLAQACVRDKRVKVAADVAQFWIGFTRRYPLADFVDVGPGKEEADNKLREVLAHNINIPQCQQVLLACCHDAGYVPVLRQYAASPSYSKRISLLSVGEVRSEMITLGFRSTTIFDTLFRPKVLPSSGTVRNRQQSMVSPKPGEASSSTAAEKFVSNSERLHPIVRKASGKRIDKDLSVEKSLVQTMKKKNLCVWHYLRSDCVKDCKRIHNYPRPLSSKSLMRYG